VVITLGLVMLGNTLYGGCCRRAQPQRIATTETTAIAREVEAWCGARGHATLPAGFSLSALTLGDDRRLDESDLVDAWARPYRLHRTSEGRWAIASYGADGRPGGTGADADVVSPIGVAGS
jgi:hypothetical protein